MEELTWGLPLFFDLWMAGVAGGAFFAAFLVNLFDAGKEKRLLRLATYLGLPFVILGVLTLVIDLGEPLRAWHLFLGLRPSSWQVIAGRGAAALRTWPPSLAVYFDSPMSMGSWILVVWCIVAVALIILWLVEDAEPTDQPGRAGGLVRFLRLFVPLTKILTWIELGFSVLMMTYTGVVLSASSQALWQTTFLLPALFVASATTTGVAALVVLAQLTKVRDSVAVKGGFGSALAVLLIVQLVLLAGYLIWLAAAGQVGPLVSGTVGILFWIGVVVLGLLVPLGLELGSLRRQVEVRGIGMLASPVLILLGGFVLRGVVIVAGQL